MFEKPWPVIKYSWWIVKEGVVGNASIEEQTSQDLWFHFTAFR